MVYEDFFESNLVVSSNIYEKHKQFSLWFFDQFIWLIKRAGFDIFHKHFAPKNLPFWIYNYLMFCSKGAHTYGITNYI